MTSRWSFRPPWWAILGTVLGCALTIRLGLWQWHRGLAREALDAQYLSAGAQPPEALRIDSAVPDGADAVLAAASGEYDGARQILLDNQVHDRTPGYQVLTPIRLASGGIALINRGWVPQNPDRRVLPQLPVPAGPVTLSGLWRSLPQPALRLKTDNCAGAAQPWPRIVEYPTSDDLRCLYGADTAAGMLLLAPEAPDGYLREWSQGDRRFPPQRHYGYAAQWFAFAATLLVIFLKLNLKRRP
ncbi:SURF1 family protein [Nevskia ramosa]|uniref:SURF1 family protein n=1 Tax=Nevskia ramosa TaxID=64002 RepID=UPI0003B5FD97|nr:SURF1 family protein [Nevskia ramosa]